MNERIKELALQAGLEMCSCGCNMPTRQSAKFAELIVRECIERVREQYIPIRDQTVEGSPNFLHPQLRVRTERETGVIECGVKSVISLEELVQEQTDKWYKENIGVEE